jgi:DNA (cytosine-5)-methyltransferase 1
VIYGSVCSGIEAATVAWKPLGWRAAFVSEIEPFPRAVLKHHHPEVPLHGEFTTIKAGDYEPIDLLVGGTPCQSFSVAGLRGGLGDDRGNLALEYLRLAGRLRPRWIVWENVPGVYSSTSHVAPDPCPPDINLDADDGPADGEEIVVEDCYDADESHAFACFLAGLSELGYGYAYRTLDAQFFGVAQRRRRVFVVGYLGDWRRAAAVLFERHSLQGHSPPRREAREGIAPTISARTKGGGGLGTDFDCDGGLIPALSHTLNAGGMNRQDFETETLIAAALTNSRSSTQCPNEDTTLIYSIMPQNSGKDYKARVVDVAQPIMASGPVGGDQGGDYVVTPFALRGREGGAMPEVGGDQIGALRSASGGSTRDYVAFQTGAGSVYETGDVTAAVDASRNRGSAQQKFLANASAVRRLTPVECERLQGFPDNYTNIPWRGKDGAPDGPRYKALGNSMAVPVMAWIGERIALVDAL